MKNNKRTRALEALIIAAATIALCAGQENQRAMVSCGAAGSTASAASPSSDKAVSQFGAQRYPRYQLRASDVLDISFEFTPEFNQSVTIQPDGYVTLRGVGDVRVAGFTVPQFTESIRTAYAKILNDPAIAVVLKDFDKPFFTAGGAIARPGKYELRGDTTVVEALTIAGGLNDSAKHSQVLLFRRVSQDWMEAKVLDVKKMLNEKNLNEDLHLKPGDMIFVPQSRISKIRRFIPTPGLGVGVTPSLH